MLKIVVLVTFCCLLAGADEITEKVFRKFGVQEGTACYRLLNGTHQYGCHASSENENGVVIKLEKIEDLENVKSCYRSIYPDYHREFWILMPTLMIQKQVMSIFKSSTCVSGLILYDETKNLTMSDDLSRSHDSEFPNENNNFYSESGYCAGKINKKQTVLSEGLRNIDWKMQMIYVTNKTDLEVIEKCYTLFNKPGEGETNTRNYPLCGMSFKLSNVAAGSSELCYRRGLESAKLFQMNIDSIVPMPLCSPLMGHNVFSWPVPIDNKAELRTEPRFMIIATRIDSFGMIPEVSPGEISVITSIIAQIAAAKIIGQCLEKWNKASKSSNKYLMFAAFNGESFDYIGSSAAVHKMRNNEFPLPVLNLTQLRIIQLNQIDYVVEVQQIGAATKSKKLYAHLDGERFSRKSEETNRILAKIEHIVKRNGYEFEKPQKTSKAPPSSWHSFAKFDENVQAIVLAPFGKEYEYSRYNSMLDKNDWNPEDRKSAIEEIATIAESLIGISEEFVNLSNSSESHRKVDKKLIETLFDCLVTSSEWFECDYLKKLDGGRFVKHSDSYQMSEKSTYVSVATNNPFRHIVHWLFVFAFGSDKEAINVKDKKSCMHLSEHQAVYAYDWQPNPYTGNFSCLRSSIQYTLYQSPAFEVDADRYR